MNVETLHLRYPPSSTFSTRLHCSINELQFENMETKDDNKITDMKKRPPSDFGDSGWLSNTFFMRLTARDVFGVVKYHPIPCIFAASLFFFMGVEYTLHMVPSSSPPFDLGFIATRPLHRLLDSKPALNTLLAGLNTGFVGMQMVYIVWAFLIEGRPRATIATLFMFTCRGILGYATQLPLPEDFLGSGADFPVGNVSFFLFYSGHVAASVIASLDMKRMQRWKLSYLFDTLNVLQTVRLLSTRGHYTIDLAVGVGAGILFDSLAGKYEENRKKELLADSADGTTNGAFHNSKLHENGEYLSLSSD
ncbi:phosphatidylcholine:diacylglycerol cholinephosphotransferase 1-like [Solanum dulcamara]|uniref:phosphatidylcholine:diacylglycerol cholinephosphotransferase 1-like n=1 Tax=Solanum dulcamara TaxID=45834 RepID=UPI002485C628|nr:phosphatidylcholine:diacylglycerol cholinephosphotransferase 1-like [Solanum dulcamara]